jgi:putative chitinase
MAGFDFNFSVTQLTQVLPGIKDPDDWFASLSDLLPQLDITSAKRVAMFLAQTGHESGNFSVLEENLNYSAAGLAKIFPSYFRDVNPNDYAHQPEKIANLVYANRMDNGDVASGDGWNFRGRGILQVSGKGNYSACSSAVYDDTRLLDTPDLLISKDGAIASACWFWDTHNLNALSDSDDINEVTLKINGGYNGLADRQARYTKAISMFTVVGS